MYERLRVQTNTVTHNRPPISSTHNHIYDYWEADSLREPKRATMEQIREEFDPVRSSMKRFETAIKNIDYGHQTKVVHEGQSLPIDTSHAHTNPFAHNTGMHATTP